MIPSAQRLALSLAVALLSTMDSSALIIYGSGPTDPDNTLNTTPPPNGAPWFNIVQFGANNASGIYLGNGFILTANHVNVVNSGIVINGVSYNRDVTFTPVQITEDVPNTAFADIVDLKLVKILGNPGLPPLPVVQSLPINFSTTADLGTTTTFIGWGVGKGSIVTDQGWNWGDDTTRAERWGLNSAPGVLTVNPFLGYSYRYDGLYAQFNRSLGASTPQVTLGDSGSGLFQNIGGIWKLSGLATLADSAFYDSNLGLPGDQPDASYFVRLQKYAPLLRYENWAQAKLGNASAAFTADLEADGIGNLLEYAFHTDPGVASVTALPQVDMESGFLTLTYTQLLSATDLSYTVQESADLSDPLGWQTAVVTEEIVSTAGVTRLVKAKVAIGAATRKFLRLSVKKLP